MACQEIDLKERASVNIVILLCTSVSESILDYTVKSLCNVYTYFYLNLSLAIVHILPSQMEIF